MTFKIIFQNITFAFDCVFQVSRMSENSYEGEEHFDQYDHYNYDQEKVMMSGNSGEWGVGTLGSMGVCFDLFCGKIRF